MNPFHLAIPINDLHETKQFYTDMFDAVVGRETKQWVDFNFYGHQLSAHVSHDEVSAAQANNAVDGNQVPVRHFGVVLDWEVWHYLAENLLSKKVEFVISPYTRFEGQPGEQATMFLFDPSGNAIEFKSFKDSERLFQGEGSYE